MSSSEQVVLELRHVSYHYPQRAFPYLRPSTSPRGIHDLNLQFKYAQTYGLVGSNGAGKSTLFKILCGNLRPTKGEIYLYDRPVTQEPQWKRARLGLGYLSQQGGLVSDLSVYVNLVMGLESGEKWGVPFSEGNTDLSSRSTLKMKSGLSTPQRIRDALAYFDVLPHVKKRIDQLSGGERRRVELARILLQRPRVLFLDEPFASLDHEGIKQTLNLLQVAHDWGAMILLTDHQNTYIEQTCNYVIQLIEGQMVGEMSHLPQASESHYRGGSS